MTRLSRYKLSPAVKENHIKDFYRSFFDQDSQSDLENFSNHLFTPTEIETFAKRIAILKRLKKGLSYWEIKDEVKVTNATITKMANILQRAAGKFIETLDKLIEDEENQKRKHREARYIKGSKQLYAKKI